MKKINLFRLAVVLSAFVFYGQLFASASKITSVSIVPTNPGYGDLVQVTVNLCASNNDTPFLSAAISTQPAPEAVGTAGQVFVVDGYGIDRKDVTFADPTQVGLMQTPINEPYPYTNLTCLDCAVAAGLPLSYVFTVHMPTADYFSSVCNPTSFYLIVGQRGNNLGASDWSNLAPGCTSPDQGYVSVPIPIVVPPASNSITNRYEGSLAAAGDEILFSMDYSYGGPGAFSITDPVPGGTDFTVVSYGPTSIPGGSVTAPVAGGTGVWNFPDRAGMAGMQTGTVWMLLKSNTLSATGTIYTNTATATQPGVTTAMASAAVTVGAPAISILKTESAASLLAGSNITYVLSYDINGFALKDFAPFDNIPAGIYDSSTGPPQGWQYSPYNGTGPGTWTVKDPCATGGAYITGSGAATTYPALLLDDGISGNAIDAFCTGMIISDFYIEDSAYSGADAAIIIRSNNLTGTAGRSIGIWASIDVNPAVLFISQCGTGNMLGCGSIISGATGSYTNTPSIGMISPKKWYRMRILAANAGTGQRIQAKVWARGDPEPAVWDLDYTVPNIGPGGDTNWDCNGTGAISNDGWRPGVGQQTGDGAGVQDSYDNFTVYAPRNTAASTAIYDTVPTGVNYIGNAGGCTKTGGVVNCDIGSVSLQSGSFTWWGTANTCNSTISNQALIFYASGSAPIASNWVAADVMCWSPTTTVTVTKTYTVTLTLTPTPFSGTGTFTQTFSPTPTMTLLFGTATFTPTVTRTVTPTYTVTPTCTVTLTLTLTSFSGTGTFTQTFSPTPTMTLFFGTGTFTQTFSPTPTMTLFSGTGTFTQTFSPTPTMTITITVNLTPSGMTLSKSVYPPYANNGDNLSYVLSYNNASGATVNAYTITDNLSGVLSTQIQFVSSLPAPTSSTGSVYTWNLGSIPPGGSGNVMFTAQVIGTDTTMMTICNRASDSTGNLTGNACLWEFTATATLTLTVPVLTLTPSATKTVTQTATPTGFAPPGTATFTQTFSPTPTCTLGVPGTQSFTPTVTLTATLTACCTGTVICTGATPVIKVFATYNHWPNGSVTIDVISNIPFVSNPVASVKPHSAHPSQLFTAVLVPQTSWTYRFVYPKQTGYGDIDTIKVAYADVCGNSGTTNGTYEKKAEIPDNEIRIYKNVIDPGKGERTRIVYNIHGAGTVKIKVFNINGTLIKELFNGTVDGGKDQDEAIWDGFNAGGKVVASGTYIITIQTSSYTVKAKVAVIR